MDDKERQERDKKNRQFLLKFALARETLDGAITEEMIDAEIRKRLQDDVYDEYLVNGALLTCTRAKWGNFSLSDGGSVKIEELSDKLKTGKPTEFLRVLENPIFANGLRHATVADTKQGWNIMPFPCNCRESATAEQEEAIKANMIDCQNHGVCKYLMELEEEWENINFNVPYAKFPDAKMISMYENVQATEVLDDLPSQQKEGITMTSVLFCKHGGFIYPLTSGQTILLPGIEKMLMDYKFTARQCMALYEIRDYLEKNPELRIGTTIFVFEGLATPRTNEEADWNGTNMYHPNGQFGAIAIVTVDGELKYAVQASTLPDDMEAYATICEGIYDIKNGYHSASEKFEGYAALWLNNNANIPAYNSIDKDDVADYIHFHMAGVLRKDHPADGSYSKGCITIPVKEYVAFGKEVGFINEGTDVNIGNNNIYRDAKSALPYSAHTKSFTGHMVIDRQYYDDTEGYLKFNAPKEEE